MGGIPTAPNPQPGALPPQLRDFSGVLANLPEALVVEEGVGGTLAAAPRDSLSSLPKDYVGRPGAETQVATNEPALNEPSLAGLGLWSTLFAHQFSFLLGFTASATFAPHEEVPGESLTEELSYQTAAQQALAEEEGIEPESPPESGEKTYETSSPLLDWYNTVSKKASEELPPVPEDVKTLLKGMSSSKPEEISSTILSLVDLESVPPEDRAVLKETIDNLAKDLATINEHKVPGEYSALDSAFSFVILPNLLNMISVPKGTTEAQQELIAKTLTTASSALANANGTVRISTPPTPPPEYNVLIGGDTEAISSFLSETISSIDLPPGVTQAQVDGAISVLAKAIGANPSIMLSTKPEDVEKALAKALSDAGLDPSFVQIFSSAFLPQISLTVADVYSRGLEANLFDSNMDILKKSIEELSGGPVPNMTPQEKALTQNYLKALVIALSFMAQMRSLISQLEGYLVQEASAAKTSMIADQVSTANEVYKTELRRIAKQYKAAIKRIHKAKLMKVLMPFIAVFVAIATVAMWIGGIAASVVSGGLAAPGAIAAVVGSTTFLITCVVGLASSVVVATLAVIDAACTWSKGKGMWQMMTEAMNLDGVLAAAVVTAINMAIAALTVVCTLGVGIASAAVQAGLTLVQAAASFLGGALTSTTVSIVTSAVITATFSGGLPLIGLQKLLKACGLNEKDSAILAAILTTLVMTMMLVASGSASGLATSTTKGIMETARGIGQSAAQAGSKLAKTIEAGIMAFTTPISQAAAKSIPEAIETAVKQLADLMLQFVKWVCNSLKNTLQGIKERIERPIQKFGLDVVAKLESGASTVPEAFKNGPCDYIWTAVKLACQKLIDALKEGANTSNMILLMQETMGLINTGLNVGAAAMKRQAALVQASMEKDLASLTLAATALEAMQAFFSATSGMDPSQTVRDVGEDAKDLAENFKKLVQLVSSFVDTISQKMGVLFSK